MGNSQKKGKRKEYYFLDKIRKIFPGAYRTTARVQGAAMTDDTDISADGICFEVKGGKQCDVKKIYKWLDQLDRGVRAHNYIEIGAVLCKPDGNGFAKRPYVIMDFEQFNLLLEIYAKQRSRIPD